MPTQSCFCDLNYNIDIEWDKIYEILKALLDHTNTMLISVFVGNFNQVVFIVNNLDKLYTWLSEILHILNKEKIMTFNIIIIKIFAIIN